MITLTANQIKLTEKNKQKIDLKISEFQKKLPQVKQFDINILIKPSALLYHPRKHYHASFGSYIEGKAAKASYIGTISLNLPAKNLRTHVMGQTLNECFKKGLDTIEKQLQKYKTTHFKSQSKYPDHASIRKAFV